MKEIILAGEGVLHDLTKAPSDSQRENARTEAMKQLRESAIKNGIVDKTKQNAQTVLSEFIGGLGFEADISFDEPAYDPEAAPRSVG